VRVVARRPVCAINGGVGDVLSELSEREVADLCALADGSLPADRVAAVEAQVAASPALAELLERQRRAVAGTRALAADVPPASLRAPVPRAGRARRRWLGPRLAAAAALCGVAVAAAVVLTGGPGAPSVADAARLTQRPPAAPAPPAAPGATLAASVDGVAFPDFSQAYGWRATGARRDRLDGRDATVVYYAKGGARLAYAIVSGSALAWPSGASAGTRDGVEYRSLRVDGRAAVTWRRAGHTCVLVGPLPAGELLTLASWQVPR
jgi:anti-sigma factor RsiW